MTTKEYLPDATDFTEMEKKPLPRIQFPSMVKTTVECPKCFGYGGWNLRLNAYKGATPEQRHFRAFCFQCHGWGYVDEGSEDATCLHEYKEIAPDQPWRCWHTYECVKCGRKKSVDSSD